MKKIITFCLLLFTVFSFAQTVEIEPNDNCTDAIANGNVITSNGIYTGTYEPNSGDPNDPDVDNWYVNLTGISDGTITINFQTDSAFFDGWQVLKIDASGCSTPVSYLPGPTSADFYALSTTHTISWTSSENLVGLIIRSSVLLAFGESSLINISNFQDTSGVGNLGFTNANLWLKANNGASPISGTLTGWTDNSTTPKTTIVNGNPQVVEQSLNYNSSVAFDGTDDAVAVNYNSNLNTAGFTISAIAKLTGGSGYRTIVSSKNGSFQGYVIYISPTNELEFWVGNGASYTILNGGTINPNEWKLITAKYDDNINTASLFVNGLQIATQVSVSHQPLPSSNQFRVGMGHDVAGAPAFPFVGEIAELFYFPFALNQNTLESYLATKYGLTLDPSVTKYVKSDGTTTWNNLTTWNDVFGIGKDDTIFFNQIISNSVNTGSGNGTGQSTLGNIIISNPSSLANGDFLMIGHDNGSLLEQTTDVPVNLPGEERVSREWKVSVTGSPSAVDLSFDTNGLTLTGTTVNDFVLMIDTDNDGDFTTGTITELSPVSFNGGVLQFHNVTFADGNVFSICTGRTPNVWNGTTWSYGTPPSNLIDAVINGDYDMTGTTDLIANKLSINSGFTVTINPGEKLSAAGHIVNNGTIVFKSDATGSGLFDTYTASPITGSGTVTTERYIPARRAFRFLTSSVTTSGSIYDNWQEGGSTASGFGTHITGTGGAANGFDATTTNNPSLFLFDPVSEAWSPVTSTSSTINAGSAYRLMVRGDRTVSLATNTPTPTNTVLRTTGSLYTGNYSPTLNDNALGYTLVGNPYQAPIDFKAVLAGSISINKDVMYYWDPTLNTRGGYVVRDLVNDVNDVTSSVDQYVQPGQAIFIQKNNNNTLSPILTISESHKSLANESAGVFRSSNESIASFLRLELKSPSVTSVLDGALILFDANNNWNVTEEDHKKLGNLDEQVGVKLQNHLLAIAKQSIPSSQDELMLDVSKYRNTNYEWTFDLQNYSGPTPYLYDAYNQSYTEIINGNTTTFTVDSQIPATIANNRFKIVFSTTALSTKGFNVSEVTLYPNPSKAGDKQYFVLTNVVETTDVTVYNTLGQKITTQTTLQNNGLQVTPTTVLNTGIYLVNINQEGVISTLKWIVE